MIYTVTLNPALDYVLTVDDLTIGKTNRSSEIALLPGGKGLNVSQVLGALGMENRALGIAGGFVGEEILRLSQANGVRTDFVITQDCSRINIKIRNMEGTEINAPGPVVSKEVVLAFLRKLEDLSDGDTLILSGAVPPGMDTDTYGDILQSLQQKNIRAIVDAEGPLLAAALPHHPFLVKPNQDELSAFFQKEIRDALTLRAAMEQMRALGAQNVLVSMGAEGAALLTKEGTIHACNVPKGTVKNAVGAGDSMIAGFLYGLMKKSNYDDALRYAVAAGSASAFSHQLATADEIHACYQQMEASHER